MKICYFWVAQIYNWKGENNSGVNFQQNMPYKCD